MSFRTYTIRFLALSILSLALCAVFNRIVDPFWFYRDFSIRGFNEIKPSFATHERQVKPTIMRRMQPASIIFGNSFFEIGLNPLHPALTADGASYNFALAGSNWKMVLCSVWFAFENDKALKRVIIGLDPSAAMPVVDCSKDIHAMRYPNELAFLLSFEALKSSLLTVITQHHAKPSHTREGLYSYLRGMPGLASNVRYQLRNEVACAANTPKTKEGFRLLVRALAQRGIDAKVLVPPMHAVYVEREYQCGLRPTRWDNLRQLTHIAEEEGKGFVEIWDFSGYHALNTESITDGAGILWQDLGHFNSEFGDRMIDEMFGHEPSRIGTRLTSSNVTERARIEEEQRAQYLRQNSEFLREWADLMRTRKPPNSPD